MEDWADLAKKSFSAPRGQPFVCNKLVTLPVGTPVPMAE